MMAAAVATNIKISVRWRFIRVILPVCLLILLLLEAQWSIFKNNKRVNKVIFVPFVSL